MRTLYFLVQEIKDSAASQETGLEKIDNRAICNIKALTKTKVKYSNEGIYFTATYAKELLFFKVDVRLFINLFEIFSYWWST